MYSFHKNATVFFAMLQPPPRLSQESHKTGSPFTSAWFSFPLEGGGPPPPFLTRHLQPFERQTGKISTFSLRCRRIDLECLTFFK